MLDNINLGIEFVGHNIDPVVPSPEYVGAQTGDIAFIIITTLVLLGIICLFLIGISKAPLFSTTTQGLHLRTSSKSKQNSKPTISAIFAAILALMLICSCYFSTKAFAGNNDANIDVTPDKIQVVVDGDTGTIQEAVFNFENNSDNFYLFDKSTTMSLTPEAAAITQAADWELQLTALETDLYKGVPDGSDYTVPGDVVTLMPHTSAQAVLKFNKSDFETAKKLVGIKAFTLTMIPDQHVVDIPTAPDNIVYNGQSQTAIPDTEAYTVKNGSGTNADSYNATVTLNSDYKWPDKSTTPQTISWTIAPLPVALSWDTPSLTYNGEAQHPTASVTNIKSSDTVTPETYSYPEGYDGISAKEQKVNVATLGGTSASNYTLEGATGNEITYTIAKKALTITADDTNKKINKPAPELTATFNGLVEGEIFVKGTDYNLSWEQPAEEVVGQKYDITVTLPEQPSQVAKNYQIETKTGTLTIVPNEPSITPDDMSKKYGEEDPASFTATVEDTDTGHDLVLGTDFTLSRAAGDKAGEYKISVTLIETGPSVIYYGKDKIICNEGTFTVEQLTVNLTWTSDSFTYTGEPQHPTASITNVKSGDDVSINTYAGLDESYNLINAGTQKCKVSELQGEDKDNYSLDSDTNKTEYSIDKADIDMDLSINGESVTKPRNFQDITLDHTLTIIFGPESTHREISYQWYEAPSFEGQQTEISGATDATYIIDKDLYIGQKFYFLKVTINTDDGNFKSTSKQTTNEKYVKFVYTAMSFNDQISNATTTLYTKYATNLLYKGETSEETGTIPTASKEGYTFGGWYTETSGGIQVVNDENVIVPGQTIEGYISSGSWVNTVEKTLYAHLYKAQYLTFTNTAEGDNTIKFTQNVQAFNNAPSLILRYSTDLVKWDVLNTSGATEQILATLNNSDKTKLYVAGYNPEGFSTATRIDSFSSTDKFSVDGNYMALIDYTRDDLKAIPNDYCFQQLFKDCSKLTSVPKLDFTFDKESQSNCLNQMFENCSLINYLEVTFTQWPTNGFKDWVKGIADQGVFICPAMLEWKVSYVTSYGIHNPTWDFCPVNFHNGKGEARAYFSESNVMHFFLSSEEYHDNSVIVPIDNNLGSPWQQILPFHAVSFTFTNGFISWTSNLRSLNSFFNGFNKIENLDLSSWDTTNVVDTEYCFCETTAKYINIENWKLEKCITSKYMFSINENLEKILTNIETDLSKADGEFMFSYCRKLPGYSSTNVNQDYAKNIAYGGYFTTEHQGKMHFDSEMHKATFYTIKDPSISEDDIYIHLDKINWEPNNFNSVEFTENFSNGWMQNVPSTKEWFQGARFTSVNLSFDGSKLKDMSEMFGFCTALVDINLTIKNGSAVENYYGVFDECWKLETVNWNISFENAKNTENMFCHCMKLTSIPDSKNWKFNKVENAKKMFYQCKALTNIDVSNWFEAEKAYPIQNCSSMFEECDLLEFIYCKADTDWSSIIPNSSNMFKSCPKLPRYVEGSTPTDATWAKPWDGESGYFTIKT